MLSEREWADSFERLEKGESSYEQEARRLGVGKGTVHRHHMEYLRHKIEEARSELERSIAKQTEVKGRLAELEQEYARREQQKKTELEQKLGPLRKELEMVTGQIRELREGAMRRGAYIRPDLGICIAWD